jgi:ATP-binding cassette subfamily B protein/subfamily B ATP-binding cassette protein MsbA
MVRLLFRHLKGYRFLVVVAIALTFAQVGASLLVAFPLKFILDKLVNHRDPHFPFAGIVLGVFDQLAPAPGGHHSAMAIILFATTLLVASVQCATAAAITSRSNGLRSSASTGIRGRAAGG